MNTPLLAAPPAPAFDNPDISGDLPFFASPLTTIRNWSGEVLVEVTIVGVVVVMVLLVVGHFSGRGWANAAAGILAMVVAAVVGLNAGTFLTYFVDEPTASATAIHTILPDPTT